MINNDEYRPFHEPWHAQIFALTIHLNEQGHFEWKDWSQAFSEALSLESSNGAIVKDCLLYTSPSPRDKRQSRMPSSA